MKWTFVQINHINDTAGWQVPDILRDGNIRYFEDALTALQFAEYKCAQFNKRHPETKKVPVINSMLHTQKMADLEIGSKAKARLGLDSGSIKMPVRNIFVFAAPKDSGMLMGANRAFGTIIKNGETQSVMNRDPFSGNIVPANMRWTNLSVLELKRKYGYPVNTFFPASERVGDDFLALPKPPPNPLSNISETLSHISGSFSKMEKSMSESTWRQMAFGNWVSPRLQDFSIQENGRIIPRPLDIRGLQTRYEVLDDMTEQYRFNNDDPHRHTITGRSEVGAHHPAREDDEPYARWDIPPASISLTSDMINQMADAYRITEIRETPTVEPVVARYNGVEQEVRSGFVNNEEPQSWQSTPEPYYWAVYDRDNQVVKLVDQHGEDDTGLSCQLHPFEGYRNSASWTDELLGLRWELYEREDVPVSDRLQLLDFTNQERNRGEVHDPLDPNFIPIGNFMGFRTNFVREHGRAPIQGQDYLNVVGGWLMIGEHSTQLRYDNGE